MITEKLHISTNNPNVVAGASILISYFTPLQIMSPQFALKYECLEGILLINCGSCEAVPCLPCLTKYHLVMSSDVHETHTSCVVVYFEVYRSAQRFGIVHRKFLLITLRLCRSMCMQPLTFPYLSSKINVFLNILYNHIP